MATVRAYTTIEQSRKLAKILPLESADMYYREWKRMTKDIRIAHIGSACKEDLSCWSLSALLDVLPEINGIPLTLEKVKAEDGYEGYYYHIEYKDIVLIPYSKNPVDACVELILKLHELNLL